ncbi:MAG: peptidylprolyl isomerase [Saprospiraceae bacterium]|nr:peptidylprolyl isomerase [Bacteroidia bacterium]NNL90946.1 peptidylprolyl isomerase [Saprospiraceae bacterium]
MINKLLFCFLALSIMSCAPKQELILIETDFGDMKISLYDSTPLHRDNIKKLVKEGFYDDLLFHRVMRGFMIQGGDPNSRGAAPGARLGSGGPGYQTPAEIGAYHFKGALSAARTPDSVNPEKKSSGSQFYIVQGQPVSETTLQRYAAQKNITYSPEDIARYKANGGRPDLDNEYTVFGEVIEGMEVIDKIAAVQVDPANRPLKDVSMKLSIVKK